MSGTNGATPAPAATPTQAPSGGGELAPPGPVLRGPAGLGKGITIDTALAVMRGDIPRVDGKSTGNARAAQNLPRPPAPAPRPAPQAAPQPPQVPPAPQARPQPPAPQPTPQPQPSAESAPDPIDAMLQHYLGQRDEGGEGEDTARQPEPGGPQPGMVMAPAEVTLAIGGQQRAFNTSQLQDLVSKGIDYTAKTQEHAQQVRQFQEQHQAVQMLLPALLPEVQRQLETLQGEEPMPDFAALVSDPAEYIRQDANWKQRSAARAAERARLAEIARAAEEQQARQLSARLAHNTALLADRIPGWGDIPTRRVIQARLLDYGRSIGCPQEELDNLYEARHVEILNKAMLFDRLMQQTRTRAPVIPAVVRGTPPTPPARGQIAQAQNRFNETGKFNDGWRLLNERRAAQAVADRRGRGVLNT